jgi:cephalosporin hydroxylase
MIDERMFDFKEFYNRIAEQLPNNCKIVEVGVADGASALYLAKRLDILGKEFKLYMVDSMGYGGYNQMKTIYQNIFARGVFEDVEVIPYDSVEASKMFNDDSLDFVFLDSSHAYEETKKELYAWYGKLKDDCILAGHDFYSEETPGVQKAVIEIIPHIITRPPINKPDQQQTFEPEQLLFTEQTERGNGIWMLKKRFYWKP